MNLLLIRHTATDLSGYFCGHADPELNAVGVRQLDALLQMFSSLNIDRVYSSDLRRARMVAEAVASRRNLEVRIRPALREINFGEWEGLRWDEIDLRFPKEAKLWLKDFPHRYPPNGEDYASFCARVADEFERIIGESRHGTTAIVTHRGVMQVLLRDVCGSSEDEAWERTSQYGSVVTLATDGKSVEVCA